LPKLNIPHVIPCFRSCSSSPYSPASILLSAPSSPITTQNFMALLYSFDTEESAMLKQLSAFLSVFFLVFLSSQSHASDTPATTTNTGHGNVAPAIVIEYPPFISQQQPDFGMSFRILTEQLAVHAWQAEPVFLPPARAAQRLLEATGWLLSCYPPADTAEPVVLNAAAIKYSLLRRTQPQPYRWQNPAELGPGVSVVTRQLPGSKELNYSRDA